MDQFHRNLSETGSRHGDKTISIRCVMLAIGLRGNFGMPTIRGIRRRSLCGLLILRAGELAIGHRRLLLLRFT